MLATVLFFFINVAYIAAVPSEDIRQSGQLIAALFFRRVFGVTFGSKVFPLMVACSCFGNIVRSSFVALQRSLYLSLLRSQWYVLCVYLRFKAVNNTHLKTVGQV